MKTTKKKAPINAIVIGAVLCSFGIYIFSEFQTTPTVSTATTKVEKPISSEKKPEPTKSASELVLESANRVTASSDNTQIDYPNVTPQKLDQPFSPTLEGTDIDGQLKVGDDGQVILDIAVKDFFDYFLSATAEVSSEVALDELLRVASESLPPENFLEVQALLNNYLSYKEDAIKLMSQPMIPKEQQTREYQLQMMEDSLAELRDLRRQHMPESQVEAFFGLEEAYEDFTLASIKVQFNDNLSADEKTSMIEYHRSLLPDEIQQTENQIASDTERNSIIQEAIESSDEDTLIQQLDSFNYSESQKQEILAYKRSQDEFDRRYQEYNAEKNSRLSDITNSTEQEEILSKLQSKYFFTEQELTQAKVRDLSS